jgi:hypothetical protein
MRITYVEISAWAEMSGACPQEWEIEAIRRIDAAVISACRVEAKQNQ